jgi:hypothetical protein
LVLRRGSTAILLACLHSLHITSNAETKLTLDTKTCLAQPHTG